MAAPHRPAERAFAPVEETVVTAVIEDTVPSESVPREGALTSIAAAGDVIRGVPGFGPPPLLTLVWDDGVRHVVHAPTVFGRNPDAVPGWRAVAVRDETLTLSRTHLAVGGERGAAWIADTGSTNGCEIVRGAERHRIAPGERWILRAGDILEFGDRRASVEGV